MNTIPIVTDCVASCSGPCDQGKKQCPCPEACWQPLPLGESVKFWAMVALPAAVACGSAWLAIR